MSPISANELLETQERMIAHETDTAFAQADTEHSRAIRETMDRAEDMRARAQFLARLIDERHRELMQLLEHPDPSDTMSVIDTFSAAMQALESLEREALRLPPQDLLMAGKNEGREDVSGRGAMVDILIRLRWATTEYAPGWPRWPGGRETERLHISPTEEGLAIVNRRRASRGLPTVEATREQLMAARRTRMQIEPDDSSPLLPRHPKERE